jgi:hypothetical protein
LSFFYLIMRICSFLDFVCLVGFGPTLWGKWADQVGVSAKWTLLAKFKQWRGLEGVALRQRASRQGQYKTKSNKSRCLKKLTWLTHKQLLESFLWTWL